MLKTPPAPQRIHEADAALWQEWFGSLQSSGCNEFGVQVERFGSALGLVAQEIPVGTFNKVLGLDPGDADLIPRIVGYYRERGLPCRIHLSQENETLEMVGQLRNRGFVIGDLHSNLVGRPTNYLPSPAQGIEVREVRAHEFDFFSGFYGLAYHDGEPVLDRFVRFRASLVRAVCGLPGWRFFMAFVGSQPAAGAILHVSDGVATLAGGATLTRFRGRGCQSALIERRLSEAAEAGCDAVTSRCAAGSTSQANLERVGMRVAYTKDIWQPRPAK